MEDAAGCLVIPASVADLNLRGVSSPARGSFVVGLGHASVWQWWLFLSESREERGSKIQVSSTLILALLSRPMEIGRAAQAMLSDVIRRRTVLGICMMATGFAARRVAVIAHRGEHLQHPENSMPGIAAAIEAGVDYVELDVRTTSDGRLVLMHDATVDSRTNGRGAVKDLSFAEIRALDCGIRMGEKFAGTKVPAFEEALQLLQGRCGLYLDWKAADASALVEALRQHEMVSRTVVYGRFEGLAEIRKLEPQLRVMPEAVSLEVLRQTLFSLKPSVVAFGRRDFVDEAIALVQLAKADVFVDRLGPDDTEASWLDAVARGATGIQTDHPAELIAVLKKRGWR